MKINMKCTNCGCEELKRKDYLFCMKEPDAYHPEYGIEAYACQKCGHVEFFDKEVLVKNQNKLKNIKSTTTCAF